MDDSGTDAHSQPAVQAMQTTPICVIIIDVAILLTMLHNCDITITSLDSLQSWLVSLFLDCPIGMDLQCPSQADIQVSHI